MKCRSGFVLAISLFWGVPAAAQLKPQVQTGSHIPVKPGPVKSWRAGLAVKGFAHCLWERNRPEARRLLTNSDQVSIDFAGAQLKRGSLVHELGMVTCLGEQANVDEAALGLELPNQLLRSLLAEEAYLARKEGLPKLTDTATESLVHHFVSTGDDLTRAKALAAFSDCVTYRDPARADALLRTMPGSSAETASARGLTPTLAACVSEGQTISFTPLSVRSLVAAGLWSRFVDRGTAATAEEAGSSKANEQHPPAPTK